MKDKLKHLFLLGLPFVFARPAIKKVLTYIERGRLHTASDIHRAYAERLYDSFNSGLSKASATARDMERNIIALAELKFADSSLSKRIYFTSNTFIEKLESELGRTFSYYDKAAIKIRVKEMFYHRPLTAEERAYVLFWEYRRAVDVSNLVRIKTGDFLGEEHRYGEFDREGNWLIFKADTEHIGTMKKQGFSYHEYSLGSLTVKHTNESFLPPFVFKSRENYEEGICEMPPGWSIEEMKEVLKQAQIEIRQRASK